jgi:transcriptional regulator with XRE-family HTH domain
MDASLSRAARGLLDWSQEQLAQRAGVGLSTVRTFESDGEIRRSNVAAIRAAFESVGVEFIARGVRQRLKRKR